MPLYNPAGGADGVNLIAAGTQTASSTGTVVFSNSNNVTFGMTNSSIVTASVTVASTQGSVNLSAGTTSNLASAFTFSNSNGLAFGLNAGTVTGSYTVPTVPAQFTGGFSTNGNTLGDTGLVTGRVVLIGGNNVTLSGSTNAGSISITVSGPNTAAQSNQQMTMFATGNTTLSSTGTSNASSLIFRGSGAASVGITNGSVLIDVAAGAAAITQSVGMSTQTAGGSTAGTTGYATGDDILYHFVPGSNITMSQSVNGASATLSIYGANGGGAATQSGWDPWQQAGRNPASFGNGSIKIDPVRLEQPVQFDRIVLPLNNTNSSNSSGSHTLSFRFGFYTRNASTLSLLSSTSSSTALTHSGTAGSYSLYSGFRIFTIPFTTTLATGDYWLALWSSTASGGANGSYSNWIVSHIGSNFHGHFGSSHATTAQLTLGMGHYSATTAALPNSIGFNQIQASGSLAQIRQHLVSFASGTV